MPGGVAAGRERCLLVGSVTTALGGDRSETLKNRVDVEVTGPARPASDPPALAYRFRIGAQPAPADAPTRVTWGENGASYQINTGSNLLNAYDYLYDSDRGLIGFRPR